MIALRTGVTHDLETHVVQVQAIKVSSHLTCQIVELSKQI